MGKCGVKLERFYMATKKKTSSARKKNSGKKTTTGRKKQNSSVQTFTWRTELLLFACLAVAILLLSEISEKVGL